MNCLWWIVGASECDIWFEVNTHTHSKWMDDGRWQSNRQLFFQWNTHTHTHKSQLSNGLTTAASSSSSFGLLFGFAKVTLCLLVWETATQLKLAHPNSCVCLSGPTHTNTHKQAHYTQTNLLNSTQTEPNSADFFCEAKRHFASLFTFEGRKNIAPQCNAKL